ncbi:odorant receptor 4-like [Monomorium pharaonis]|uniref:odorant receptor 4-like n=1 Tax=Monomorium pharaonis TaxID=307658 RepID=UPI001747238E|nr:odorant receptor 4-like [Monomorium pharaonis]
MKQTPTSTINRAIEIPLRIFGIWPGSSYILFCRLFWTITIAAIQSFQYRYVIKRLYTVDLSDLMECLSVTLTYSQFFFKIINFWLNQRTLDKILAMMAMDWKKSSNTDFSKRATIGKAILSHNISNLCFGSVVIAVIFYTVSVFTYNSFNLDETDISMRPLILKMDFPFSGDTRFVYEIILLSQGFCTVLTACGNVMLNTLLIVLVLHLGGQIEILSKWITEVISDENEYKLNLTIVGTIIEKHQNIITFSKSIENIFSDITLVLFVADTLTICSIGFVLVTSIGRPDAVSIVMKILGFYFIINFEVFMFCFAGEYLSSKSKVIGDAAYSSRWYQCKFQDSRVILFLIMRSQNQMSITVGKFMDLSFERFVSILKASASYVSFMLALY